MTAAVASQPKAPSGAKAAPKSAGAPLQAVPLDRRTPPTGLVLRKSGACACGGVCPRCQKQPIQTKLSVSEPADVYEQEADRAAEQVMRAPEPARDSTPARTSVQRQCATGAAAQTDDETLQAKPAGATSANPAAPSIVHDAVRAPGKPLDADARRFFEPRFGRDLSQVRIHTDDKAAQSAQAVDALAYTVGSDVVFGAGQYAPATGAGRRLLAHELAHTVQQRESQSLQRQRRPGTSVSVTASGNCTVGQGSALTAAITTAIQWLGTAIQLLHRFEALPLSTASVAAALQFHFHTTNPFHAALIRTRLAQVRDGLTSPGGAPSDCAAAGDTGCGSATVGYQQGGHVVWCPFLFDLSPPDQAQTIVHEYTHAQARRLPLAAGFAEFSDGTPRRIADRAYIDRRYYLDLTLEEAMDNADSYANLVEDLGTGTAVTQAPSQRARDTMTGCAPGQQELIRQSLSQIAKWNDAASKTLHDTIIPTYPILDVDITRAIRNRLGASPLRRDVIARLYDVAGQPLLMGLTLACPSARGNCSSNGYLWQQGERGTINVCPAWIGESDALLRNRMLYSAILSNIGLRLNPWPFVDLARDLEGLHLVIDAPPPALPTDPFPQSTIPGTAIG